MSDPDIRATSETLREGDEDCWRLRSEGRQKLKRGQIDVLTSQLRPDVSFAGHWLEIHSRRPKIVVGCSLTMSPFRSGHTIQTEPCRL